MSAAVDSDLQRQLAATTRLLAEFQIKYVDRGRRIEELEQQIAELTAPAGRTIGNRRSPTAPPAERPATTPPIE